ncbi:MAG: polyribonucleotide nucleotidyltransferase [Parcubacteria group bacterium]|nr:polyribonucleotide nucleotidyltransferase [Parcubacteria group bacterium]
MQKKEFALEVAGKQLTAVFSDLAEKANGSVLLSYGNTTVLATAVISAQKREGIDFFPLVVDYEEKFYAAGEILGSRFVRREGRPSDEAVLGGRAVDRTIRPFFDQRLRNEVQVVITVISLGDDDPDVLAINAASLALATSDIPWGGPVSAIRIDKHADDGGFAINPEYKHRNNGAGELDAIMCGKDGNLVMIEAGARDVSEEIMDAAFARAIEEIEKLQAFQKKIIAEVGKTKRTIAHDEPDGTLLSLYREKIAPRLEAATFGPKDEAHTDLKAEWLALYEEAAPEGNPDVAGNYFEERVDELIHREALENNRRPDGRGMDEIRPLYAQAGGISPVLHGTGLFYRGQTHVLSILTLGGPGDAQLVEGMEVRTQKRFMHHYNFPPFSSGETGRIGGMNRRMIGHGALAEKALSSVIPPKETFPYTIRIVSEVLSSNGSTSMGSVCAGTLALMDAGVPITKPVGGMAMGLILENPKSGTKDRDRQITNYKILTDIQGPEDHHGDMDFKVAGTRDGITAIQMDIKVDGIPVSILSEALRKAKAARLAVLDAMERALPAPRPALSPAAPKILVKHIPVEKIGLVIGPSGKTINKIIAETSAEIDIEEDGTIFIVGKNGAAEAAEKMVEEVVHEYRPGERFEGTVSRLFDFGAMVKISPHAEGLVHISEFAPVRINQVTDLVKEGDRVPVVVSEIDEKGRVNLSIKQADPNFFTEALKRLPPAPPRLNNRRGDDDRRPPRRQSRY